MENKAEYNVITANVQLQNVFYLVTPEIQKKPAETLIVKLQLIYCCTL